MSTLFSPITLRGLTLANRVWISPMCQYSATDGQPTQWHVVHLGSRAVGGAGLVILEATAVVPEGRISAADLGLWSDSHADGLRPIAALLRSRGTAAGIQLAHAGRKASTRVPWQGVGPLPAAEGGWQTVAPSPITFADSYPTPHQLSADDVDALPEQFAAAAARAVAAGFDLVELHAAHGYLLHQFLSPLSNQRRDDWGGSLENRMRAPLAVAGAVRAQLPATMPLFVRLSCTDWAEGGWDLPSSLELADRLREVGVDLIDCSSGGLVPHARVPVGPGYQVPFAAAIRQQAGIAAAAVGLITEPAQAEQIIANGHADAIFIGRASLRDPYWPLHAATSLGADVRWPDQYLRAQTR